MNVIMPKQRMYAFSVLLLSFWVELLEKTYADTLGKNQQWYSYRKPAVVLLEKHMVVLLQKTCSGMLGDNIWW